MERPAGTVRTSPFERLELVHAGTVDSWSADLTPVIRAILQLAESQIPVRLTLLGPLLDRSPELDHAVGSGQVHVAGKVSRREAQAAAAAGDIALVVQKRPSAIWVTTKLWDYLASGTPVLVAADPGCDAAAIVRPRREPAGPCPTTRPRSRGRCRPRTRRAARRGVRLWHPDPDALGRYDSKAISRRFLELLREIVS